MDNPIIKAAEQLIELHTEEIAAIDAGRVYKRGDEDVSALVREQHVINRDKAIGLIMTILEGGGYTPEASDIVNDIPAKIILAEEAEQADDNPEDILHIGGEHER